MTESRVPDLETVASPTQRELDYYDLEIEEEPLGKGGQTVVYEARVPDATPSETVAVRQLGDRGLDKSVDREEVTPFIDQAETWASLARRERTEPRWHDSDHIVSVVAVGDRLPWAALEYMDGGSLADRLDGTDGLGVAEAVWVAERLCRGLEVAHNTGVAHLDLKPGNILFRETDQDTWDVPKIADWGLARSLLDETSASMEVLSTRYAAPEQFDREEFGRPGTATDIYQLGAVVYALLTGEPPYTGTERSVLFDIVTEELPPPPSQRRSEISRELDAVVQTALEPRKSDRYGSIETFKRALRAIRLDSRLQRVVTERIEATEPDPVTRWPMFGRGPAQTGALDGHSGPDGPVTTRWQFDTDGLIESSPAVADGTVYVGSWDWSLYAVDAVTGDKQWQFDTSRAVESSPAVADGTVYVGSYDNSLYAVDTATGQKQWRFRTDGWVESSPAVADDTVYVGSEDGCLYAVDAATGTKRWQFDTAHWVSSSPAVVDGTIYVGSGDNSLYAVDAVTGKEQWAFETGYQAGSSPAVVDGTVYVGSNDGCLYAVDTATGQKQWQFDTDLRVRSSPAVVDGTVYVGCYDNSLYAVDATTGDRQWQFDTSGEVKSSPAVTDGTVYVGSGDESLYAVDAATGTQQWQFDTSDAVRSSPAVVDGTVYVGSDDNSLYAIEGNE